MQLAQCLVVLATEHLGEPVVEPGKDREHSTKAQHIVEMRHHIVGVMQRQIEPGIGQNHTRDTADGEQEDEADRPEHGRVHTH